MDLLEEKHIDEVEMNEVSKDVKIAELEDKIRITENIELCMDNKIGMSRPVAKAFIESLAINDLETAFLILADHIKFVKNKARKELCVKNPNIQTQNNMGSLAVQKAKELSKGKKGVDIDALRQYM